MATKQEIIDRLDLPALILELVPSCHLAGAELTGLCPFHDDHNSSFSANPKTGAFKCFACSAKGSVFDLYGKVHGLDFKGSIRDLTRRAGLEPGKGTQRVTGRFDYSGTAGGVLYWKERLEPGPQGRSKEFLFYHGNRQIGRGCEPVLYNLPDVLTAKELFITEGEKKADKLKSWGFTATTLDSGAQSKLTPSMVQQLTKKKIVILPDNDVPGREFAGRIATAMQGKAVLKIIDLPGLPQKGDILDWIQTPGNDKARLKEIVSQAPLWTPPLTPDVVPVIPEIQEAAGWPEPVLFGEIVPPEIPCSLLPGWLGDFAGAVAENTQTPPAMSVMMALSTVAACVQKRFKVARTPEHQEPLALWTATALPPASRKTAVVKHFTEPILQWEKTRAEALKPERTRVENIRVTTEGRIKRLQTQATNCDDPTERGHYIDEACRLQNEMPEPVMFPQIILDNTTPENTENRMVEQGERIAVISDEGGMFSIMAGLYSAGKANNDVFLKSHAGSTIRVSRSGRTAFLDEPALTFGFCIQPDILKGLASTNFRGNGMLARFLFALPKSNIGLRSVNSPSILEAIKIAYHAGIITLLNILPVVNEFRQERPRIITLTPGANSVWEFFFDAVEGRMKEGHDLEPLQDWGGKLPGAVLRIAALMALVEQGESTKTIILTIMERAIALAELLITHAKAAFRLIEGGDSQHDALHVFKWIMAKGALQFRQSEAQLQLTRFREVERLERALEVLAKRHIVSDPEKVKPVGGKGRSSIVYHVNPALLQQQ